MTTRDPRAALAWRKAGRSIRIVPYDKGTVAVSRFDYWRHITALAKLEAKESAA